MNIFLTLLAGIALLLAIYLRWIRPWQLHYGATDAEVEQIMPGDEVTDHPDFNATRAITIHGRPEQIWPWLVQIGFGRAGFYSYDWIDNLGKPSADRIMPELQNLQVGDKIALSKWTSETVRALEPNKFMVWRGGEGNSATDGTWVWGIYPIDENSSRLVIRMRGHYDWFSPWIFVLLIVDVFDIIMMRKLMLNLKKRVEKMSLAAA
jgi:hypothetical protein